MPTVTQMVSHGPRLSRSGAVLLATETYCLKYVYSLEEFPLCLPKPGENSNRDEDEAVAESSMTKSSGEKVSLPQSEIPAQGINRDHLWFSPAPPPPLLLKTC